jgi:D-glycero-alpha-D-manno-heptose-7-phosphate kinase
VEFRRSAVSVPVRICDIGGWTDTWFGAPGRVVNLAVRPGITVALRETTRAQPVPSPLVQAALDLLPPPQPVAVDITTAVPPGCGAGTSAAVAVAMLAALTAHRGEPRSPLELAYAAHRLEVDTLGRESGIQDQLSAALGGINFLTIDEYPRAHVERLPAWAELDDRLTLLYLGQAHDSPAVHRQVINEATPQRASAFDELRAAAESARAAVLAQDLHAFGDAMIANTDAQRALHPALIGADATRAIAYARDHGAMGWKVNGAGGDGGSLTLLSADATAKAEHERGLAALNAQYQVVAVRVSESGVVVLDQ